MNETTCKRLDLTIVRHVLDKRLEPQHARWLRGAVAKRSTRVEFHQHDGDRLIYHHPLVRYDASTGSAVIAGLAEGGVLLRSLPRFEGFSLGGDWHEVIERDEVSRRIEVGPTPFPIEYVFQTPYLALNQGNFPAWSESRPSGKSELLQRVVVGNMLSLSKAIGLHVEERLQAEVDLEPIGWQELKPGVRLMGFRGKIRVNYTLPDLWGIGKSSARGFGTLLRSEKTHG